MRQHLRNLVILLAVFGGLPFDVMTDSPAYATPPPLKLDGGFHSTLSLDLAPNAADFYSGNVSGGLSWQLTMKLTPTEAGAASFLEGLTSSLFHGTRKDQVFTAGWNFQPNGVRVNTSDAAIGDQWESYYEQDASNTWLERHFVYIDVGGNYYRPLSFRLDRHSGAPNGLSGYFGVDEFDFTDRNAGAGTGRSYFTFFSGTTASVGSNFGQWWIQNGGQVMVLTNNSPWLAQINAAGNNKLYLTWLDNANKVEVGIGSTGGGDAAGVIIGGTSSTNTIQGTQLNLPARMATTGTTPTCTAGAAAGASPSCSVAGTPTLFAVTVNTGTGTASGTLATVTYPVSTFGAAPRIVCSPNSTAAAAGVAKAYFTSTSSAATISANAAIGDTNTFTWNCLAMQ